MSGRRTTNGHTATNGSTANDGDTATNGSTALLKSSPQQKDDQKFVSFLVAEACCALTGKLVSINGFDFNVYASIL